MKFKDPITGREFIVEQFKYKGKIVYLIPTWVISIPKEWIPIKQ